MIGEGHIRSYPNTSSGDALVPSHNGAGACVAFVHARLREYRGNPDELDLAAQADRAPGPSLPNLKFVARALRVSCP